MAAKPSVIKNEDDAYELLVRLSKGHSRIKREDIKFEGWPKLRIHLTGERYHQTITPTVMRGFVELQRSLLRSYAITRYGTPSVRLLTRDERRSLEIEVKVSDGSSNFEIDLQALLVKMIDMVGAKMEPEHVLMLVMGIAVLYFGKTSFKDYLEHRRLERERVAKSEESRALIEQQKFASQEETKRMQVIAEIAERNTDLLNIARGAYDARTALVRSVETADEAKIQGVKLDGELAHELTKNARRHSEEVRLDGSYRILRVDSSDPTEFKMRVMDTNTRMKLDTVVNDRALSPEVRKFLQSAEWERKNIRLEINAREIGEKFVDATVIGVHEVD